MLLTPSETFIFLWFSNTFCCGPVGMATPTGCRRTPPDADGRRQAGLKMLRVAAAQLRVTADRADNLRRAAALVDRAAAEGARFVALPECFVGKYGVEHFPAHAEDVAAMEWGCGVLAAAARRSQARRGAQPTPT